MKLSVKAFALTAGILWGGWILLIGIANLVWPGYGSAMLDMARSMYPGYAGTAGFVGVVVGTLYGLVDGAVCGAVFAWLYNKLSGGATSAGSAMP